jgi:cobalt-zinc-cadmium efflux system protein
MSGGHGHHHAPAGAGPGRERRLATAIGLNAGIVVAQALAGLVAGSLGLLADAAHNLTDVVAIAVSLVAVRLARRPRTDRRSFGWHRATVLAALFNAVSGIAVSIAVAVEALRRLGDADPVDGALVIALAGLGAVVNTVAALVVADGSGDLNMRGALLHLVSDALTSVAVAGTGAVIVVLGGWYWLDPAAALAISAVIVVHAVQLARAALDILLESTPAGVDVDEMATQMASVEGVEQIHDLHAWTITSGVHALSAHVVVTGHPSLEQAQHVAGRVRLELSDHFAITHATLELECEPCAPDPRCEVDAI